MKVVVVDHLSKDDLLIAFKEKEAGKYQARAIVKQDKNEYKVEKGITLDFKDSAMFKICRPVSDKENVVTLPK